VFTGREKKNRRFPPEKFWFRSFVWLGENQKSGGTGSFVLGIGQFPPFWPIQFVVLYGNGVPKKSRAQKMSGGAAAGGRRAERPACRQAGNSDEARTAKPDERGADAMR